MKTKIKVKQISDEPSYRFEVVVGEGEGDVSEHSVTMGRDFYEGLRTEAGPEEVIEESFRFLLSKEPKEMIMREFDVVVISNYFPEYEKKLEKRLVTGD